MATKLAPNVTNNYFFVDSRRLLVDEEYIEREDYGDIESLVRWIQANGLHMLDPLKVYKQGENYVIIRGHRRNKAIKILEGKSKQVLMVPVYVDKKGASLERRYFEQAHQNGGKDYTPWEKAKVVGKMRTFGWDEATMVKESGWSLTYVRRLLSLVDAPHLFIELIRQGRLTGTLAMDIIAEGKMQETLEKAANNQLLVIREGDDEIFRPEATTKRITRASVKPVSWKKIKKWSSSIEEDELSPDKVKVYKFVQQLLAGSVREDDFKKFFR